VGVAKLTFERFPRFGSEQNPSQRSDWD